MRDYAETVQAMRYAFEQPCYDCVLGEKCNWGDFCFFKRAADAIEELLAELTTIRKQLPHWVSAEDELTHDCPLIELPQHTVETNLFDIEEIHHNCTVQILRNSITGEVSVGWWSNDNKPKEGK